MREPMAEQRRLTEWLADYRDTLDRLCTPLSVEARLRAEVRRRRRIPVAPWILAAGAAAALLLGIWIGRSRVELAQSPGLTNVRPVPSPLVELAPAEELEPAAGLAPDRRLLARRARPIRKPADAPRPVPVFVMLPGSELMPPAQDLQVLRVRIPRTRIQALGWPVNVDRLDERVLADVVVGGDGVARAVRLVQASQ